jgi:ATP-dependent RNA helicase DeaD
MTAEAADDTAAAPTDAAAATDAATDVATDVATDATTDPPRMSAATGFAALDLPEPIVRVLLEVGYETPTPIQAQTIPLLLAGKDLLGQAQTGTGKTAAFALPILARLDLKQPKIQALVLTPTRELGIQVAEAFQRYAANMPGFRVLPVYGGQSYGPQLSALSRGVHVVVGTPGRILDHLDRGSIDLSHVRSLVLDEADEMLRMGFIADVESILGKTPNTRQTCLFSATLPAPIRRIAQTHMNRPVEVTIAAKTRTADNIRQRFWQVSGLHKLDALTRILEAEPFDAMIVFARTKQSTDELAEKLQARGFAAAAINGDIHQSQRERTIAMLRDGKIDILVATDVAARGLDVDRISHVLNYDVPADPESYVHRIGRTGRAGRSGEAILFVAPRELSLLRMIERATRQPITVMPLPTVKMVNDVRISKFKQQISDTLAAGELLIFQSVVEEFEREQNVPAIEIAAALAKMARAGVPLLLEPRIRERDLPQSDRPVHADRPERPERPERPFRDDRDDDRPRRPRPERSAPPPGTAVYRIEVGHDHGVRPGNIVGAIANEAGLDIKQIGRIEIFGDHSLIDLPAALPDETLALLKTVWCSSRQLRITRDSETPDRPAERPGGDRPPRRRILGGRLIRAHKPGAPRKFPRPD